MLPFWIIDKIEKEKAQDRVQHEYLYIEDYISQRIEKDAEKEEAERGIIIIQM